MLNLAERVSFLLLTSLLIFSRPFFFSFLTSSSKSSSTASPYLTSESDSSESKSGFLLKKIALSLMPLTSDFIYLISLRIDEVAVMFTELFSYWSRPL